MSADDVVRTGLGDLDRGRAVSIPGRRYQAVVLATRLVPPGVQRALVQRLSGRMPAARR
jgi:hypothetical protein